VYIYSIIVSIIVYNCVYYCVYRRDECVDLSDEREGLLEPVLLLGGDELTHEAAEEGKRVWG
jgi:hypothetical protein